jgi:hypothetical protein
MGGIRRLHTLAIFPWIYTHGWAGYFAFIPTVFILIGAQSLIEVQSLIVARISRNSSIKKNLAAHQFICTQTHSYLFQTDLSVNQNIRWRDVQGFCGNFLEVKKWQNERKIQNNKYAEMISVLDLAIYQKNFPLVSL